MTNKISIIIAVALLLLGGLAAWYVQGLRADNARLNASLAIAQALNESRARQLDLMRQRRESFAYPQRYTPCAITCRQPGLYVYTSRNHLQSFELLQMV